MIVFVYMHTNENVLKSDKKKKFKKSLRKKTTLHYSTRHVSTASRVCLLLL